jgi:hypothetical protein
MGLTMVMEHPVEAALGTDIQASISQDRHDLPRRQGRELGLVAGEQNPLTLLIREAVRNQAVAAFTAIQAVPITRKLTSPALQGGEPHAQQICHFLSPSTSRYGGIKDLQGLAAILRRGQSTSSSPQ